MEQRIGSCSLCGGDVMAHRGPWWGTMPPPPPTCAACGAVEIATDPIIQMRPRRQIRQPRLDAYASPGAKLTFETPALNTAQLEEIKRFWKGDGWRP